MIADGVVRHSHVLITYDQGRRSWQKQRSELFGAMLSGKDVMPSERNTNSVEKRVRLSVVELTSDRHHVGRFGGSPAILVQSSCRLEESS